MTHRLVSEEKIFVYNFHTIRKHFVLWWQYWMLNWIKWGHFGRYSYDNFSPNLQCWS